MHKWAEMKGSAKTLTKNIEMMRAVMGTRGPWKRSIGLRAYHDELLFRLAKARYQVRFD